MCLDIQVSNYNSASLKPVYIATIFFWCTAVTTQEGITLRQNFPCSYGSCQETSGKTLSVKGQGDFYWSHILTVVIGTSAQHMGTLTPCIITCIRSSLLQIQSQIKCNLNCTRKLLNTKISISKLL